MSRTVSRQGSVARTVQRSADPELAGRAPLDTSAFAGDLGEERAGDDVLRASEQLYRSIVETLDEGVMVQDLDGRVVAFNKSALQILGLAPEQLGEGSSYRPLTPLIHEDGSPFPGHEHPSMVSLRTGEPQTGVVMGVVHPDGETRWISINSRALFRGGESTPYAAVGSFSDVTAHRGTLAQLHAARLEDLERLALVGEYRDDDTNRHTERVAHTAALLAGALGLDGELTWTIRRAAPLHDVGKIGVSDTILLKPGKLTVEEFEAMKAHTSIGGRILGESDFRILQMATEIALTHHERWDGTGYPARLRGEEIPISGRIVAVADAFDAMTHARPYKEAFPVDRAVAEIECCSGTQFDPRVVAVFMTLEHERLVDTV
jgi:putative two-component system response regulator